MQKFLWTGLLIISLILCIAISIVIHRGGIIKQQEEQICGLQTALAEYQKIQETYLEAEKQAKEFEKELAKDENSDNLDIVPDKYILDQLHTD